MISARFKLKKTYEKVSEKDNCQTTIKYLAVLKSVSTPLERERHTRTITADDCKTKIKFKTTKMVQHIRGIFSLCRPVLGISIL